MVRINGDYDLEVYDLDTLQSILRRLASKMQTLPRYLYFPDGPPTFTDFINKDDLQVENLLELIKNTDEVNFARFYEQIKDKIVQQKLDLYVNVFCIFIANQNSYGNSTIRYFQQTQIDTSPLFDNTKFNIDRTWNNKSDIKNNIKEEINLNKSKVEKQTKLSEEFKNIKGSVKHTDFELEESMIGFELDLREISLIELFNYLHLNPEVPFASFDNFFQDF